MKLRIIMKKITPLRMSLGLTQAGLGRKARVHSSTVSRVERGHAQPTPPQLRGIARALGVPAAEAGVLLEDVDPSALAALAAPAAR
jgi:transcriptional regulator with XRE-family HTH domain